MVVRPSTANYRGLHGKLAKNDNHTKAPVIHAKAGRNSQLDNAKPYNVEKQHFTRPYNTTRNIDDYEAPKVGEAWKMDLVQNLHKLSIENAGNVIGKLNSIVPMSIGLIKDIINLVDKSIVEAYANKQAFDRMARKKHVYKDPNAKSMRKTKYNHSNPFYEDRASYYVDRREQVNRDVYEENSVDDANSDCRSEISITGKIIVPSKYKSAERARFTRRPTRDEIYGLEKYEPGDKIMIPTKYKMTNKFYRDGRGTQTEQY